MLHCLFQQKTWYAFNHGYFSLNEISVFSISLSFCEDSLNIENDHGAVRYELNSAHTQLWSLTSLETMAFFWVAGNVDVDLSLLHTCGDQEV